MKSAGIQKITAKVNGEEQSLPDGCSVAALLADAGLDPRLVVVELNGRILRQPEHQDARISSGAVIEIVHFVGGG